MAIAPVGALERLRRKRQESPFDVRAAAAVDSVAGLPSGLENCDLMLSGCVVSNHWLQINRATGSNVPLATFQN